MKGHLGVSLCIISICAIQQVDWIYLIWRVFVVFDDYYFFGNYDTRSNIKRPMIIRIPLSPHDLHVSISTLMPFNHFHNSMRWIFMIEFIFIMLKSFLSKVRRICLICALLKYVSGVALWRMISNINERKRYLDERIGLETFLVLTFLSI
jgi:hypothetical protein